MSIVGVGISIGTCHSSVAVFKEGNVTILRNERGHKLTPSVVSFDGREFVSGEEAMERLVAHPEDTLYDITRMIGRISDDNEIHNHMRYWPFTVASHNGRYHYCINDNGEHLLLWPEQIFAILVRHMKRLAEAYIEASVTEAVLTVPASFGINQRVAIRQAGKIAGLTTVYLVNEPTAVALAYVFDRKMYEPFKNDKQEVLFCNLGGGSSDSTFFTLKNTRVLARSTCGCPNLGGVDYTNSIAGFLAEEMRVKRDYVIYQNPSAVMRLKNASERIKKELSVRKQSEIKLDGLSMGFDFKSSMTKLVFENILFGDARLRNSIRCCIRDSHIAVGEVMLTGGTSRVPYFRNMVRDVATMAPDLSMHAEESAIIGAAVRAANLGGASANAVGALDVTDVIPTSVKSISAADDDQTILRRNHRIPCELEYCLVVPSDAPMPFSIKLYEGELMAPKDNTALGVIYVSLQEGQARCNDTMRVSVEVDSSGILTIPRIELLPYNKSLDFRFERRSLPEDEVNFLAERFPTLGVDA